MAASVSTRVVSWKLAAEMKLSVDRLALVMPSSSGRADRGPPAGGEDALVLLLETPPVDLLVDEELGVADLLDLHRAHHLTDDDLDVLVVDLHALRPVDLLDLVGHVALQLLLAQHLKHVVRVDRAVDQRIAGVHALAVLDVDVHRRAARGTRDSPACPPSTVTRRMPLWISPSRTRAVDLGDDRRLLRAAGLEQLHHPRQTAGDVLGLGRLGARDLDQHVAGGDLICPSFTIRCEPDGRM